MSPSTKIHCLPNEVLLEIFDSFRQTFQREHRYEKIWNSSKGWFKLAHVCREWRQVVVTSPSRLHVRLLITVFRSGRSNAIRRLPPLPIVIDHKRGWVGRERSFTVKLQQRLISGLAYPDRVCAIAFDLPGETWDPKPKVLAAVSQTFPALERLELYCPRTFGPTPPPFLTGQAPHLRHLTFLGGVTDFYRILPYTASLVDLTFGLRIFTHSPLETQLLAHLRGMSSLRCLEVQMSMLDCPPKAAPDEREEVLLPTLTSFSFRGSLAVLDALIPGLAAPSLRELRISFPDIRCTFPRAHGHLTSFIRNAGRQFFSAQFGTSKDGILKDAANMVLSTHPHSIDDLPFRIIVSGLRSIPLMGDLFSESLATVEDAFLASSFDIKGLLISQPFEDPVQSYTFFTLFRGAKILRVSPEIAQEIGDIFRNEDLPLNILPSLEEIELTSPCTRIQIDENQVASVPELFKPFVDTRQRAGSHVKVHWTTDQVLPEYFCNTDM